MNLKKTEEDHRPWGYYTVLSDESDHKVKRIVVHPGRRLSLQRHFYRGEHWYILKGEAVVTLNQEEIPLKKGRAVDIPPQAWHRIRNTGVEDLIFIEVQTGEYFGEDDIERAEDDYGRVG
jgi:mannose-6-phosphate isomerase